MASSARWSAVLSLALCVACGGAGGGGGGANGGTGGDGGTPPGTATIGPSGGTVSLPGGPTLQVPPGALAAPTTITVAASTTRAPTSALTSIFQFGPEGTTFAAPATVSFPVPAGTTSDAISVLWTRPGTADQWDRLAATVRGTTASAQVTHFSSGYVATTCSAGATCAPAGADPCKLYATTCSAGQASCAVSQNAPDGTACGGANVCTAGACGPPAACVPGAACAPAGPADPCKVYETACNGARVSCAIAGNVPDGTACGGGNVCTTGTCGANTAPTCNRPGTYVWTESGDACAPGCSTTFEFNLDAVTAAAGGPVLVDVETGCPGSPPRFGQKTLEYDPGTCALSAAAPASTACTVPPDFWVLSGSGVSSCSVSSVTESANACTCSSTVTTCPATFAPAQTHAISGRISGAASAGVLLFLDGAGGTRTVVSDALGGYAFTGLVSGSYTVAPVSDTVVFSPPGRGVELGASDVASQDFVASASQIPAAPAGLTAFPGDGSVALSWAAASTPVTYNLYQSATPDMTVTTKTSVPFPFTTRALPNGTAAYFAVSSVGAAGEGPLSPTRCAVASAASTAGLSLYDPLCETELDGRRWRNPGVREAKVSGGAAVLTVEMTDLPSRTVQGDVYAASATVNGGGRRVTTLAADVTVPAAQAARTGIVQLRAPVRLVYSPPALRLDAPGASRDAVALEVGLLEAGTGLYAYRSVSHCDDAACATSSASGIAFADPLTVIPVIGVDQGVPASYDASYTATAALDESTGVFSWSIVGPGVAISGTADPASYLATAPGWAGVPLAGAGFQAAQIAVRVLDASDAGGGDAAMTAQFRNVHVGLDNGAAGAWDDFSGAGGNSGPAELAGAKWSDGGGASFATSTALAGGGLVLHGEVTATGAAPFTQWVELARPAAAGTVQADVAIASPPAAGSAAAHLQGRFYNTGTPTAGTPPDVLGDDSAVGDVLAEVTLDAVANAASWRISRCETATCASTTVLGSGAFAGVTVGTAVHTLLLRWDPIARTFTLGVDASTVSVDPSRTGAGGLTTAAPFAAPAHAPIRRVATTLGSAGSGSLDVRIDDVFTAP